jgi:predicted N-formylglutamate amidohydrolase
VRLILSCEHASNRVPRQWARLFAGAGRVLASHRGYDLGSLGVARRLSRALGAPLHAGAWTRLLVDLNRSLGHPRVFSEYTRALPEADRQRLVSEHYRPHRRRVEEALAREIDRGSRVIHLSVHSFTPVWRGQHRRTDVGLLYDPARRWERRLCATWQSALRSAAPGLRVHRNAPYRGSADGLTTQLRRRFRDVDYAGLELELNQRHLRRSAAQRARLLRGLERSLAVLLGGASAPRS